MSRCPRNGVGVSDEPCFRRFFFLEVLRCRHTVSEGDGERVQCWLPPCGPSCLPEALGVQPAGDQVEALERGLLGREVPAGPNCPAVARVQALDRVGREENSSDLDVVGQERGEFLPRRPPQFGDRRVGLAPLLLDILERGPRGLDRRRRVDRLQVPRELVPVLA